MEHNPIRSPATDEQASPATPEPVPGAAPEPEPPELDGGPAFATEAEQDAFRRGLSHGIRNAGREPGHPHMPDDFSLDLTRDGAAPGLVSARLLDPWPYVPSDQAALGNATHGPVAAAKPRAPRPDGWNPEKEQAFLKVLANTGVVADACRAVKMSRDAAYSRRNSASGRAFALGWEAAQLVARGPIVDDVLSRVRHGVIERVYRNGELVAERHRYDNRLTMAVLTRLDRLAEGHGENAPVIRAVADEFDRFLDLLPRGVAGAEQFLAARFPPPLQPGRAPPAVEEPPTVAGDRAEAGTELARLARLRAYEEHGLGLPGEVDLDELGEMEEWTDEQCDLAEFSGVLGLLPDSAWPDSARDAGADGTDGMCKLRKLYLEYEPKPDPFEVEKEDDFAGCEVWEERADEWMTNFPPPAGFDGYEEGEPGEADYKRELTDDELVRCGADPDTLEAERAERLAEEHAARRRFFDLEAQERENGAADSPP